MSAPIPPYPSASYSFNSTHLEGANPLAAYGAAPASSELPPWDSVEAEHVVPAISALLEELEAELVTLEKGAAPTWESVAEPLEVLGDRLSRAWGTVSHLKGVQDSDALRAAVEEVQPRQVAFGLRVGQSEPIYRAFKGMRDDEGVWGALSEAQRRVVEAEIRDAELSGVALTGEAKEEFNTLQQEAAQLSTKFSNNVLDATKAFERFVEDKAELEGLPDSALALAAQTAASKGREGATAEDGPWCITLDFPSYMPVMQHAKNRALREEVYLAFLTRASSGETDNAPLIERILEIRKRKAELLGYEHFADTSLAAKMADLGSAKTLLEELRAAAYEPGVRELEEVRAFAEEQGADYELKHWDMTFWAERLREERYAYKEEDLRPYFSLPAVLDGLFGLIEKLFGFKVVPADGESPVWHKDVRYFKVLGEDGAPRASFYLDPYSRPAEKRGGAWMDEVLGRSALLGADGETRLPTAHMVCNQSPPVGDKPSLMTIREVETLFHEMGHALQHMLTTQSEGMVAGIRGVEWDAVELPSQFMENFVYHKDTLLGFAKHYETGEPLPEELFNKIVEARKYRAGTVMLRQVHFSLTDLELHSAYAPGTVGGVFALEKEIAKTTSVLPPLDADRFLCGFSHIFAGGYSAGYYSYKWAEVLSADAFGAFEEAGLDDDEAVRTTGRRFAETVLAMGGGRDPTKVFEDFRGRGPSTEALLRHSGLAPVAA